MFVTIVTEVELALLWPMLAKRDSLKIVFWLSVVLYWDLLFLDVAKLGRLSARF